MIVEGITSWNVGNLDGLTVGYFPTEVGFLRSGTAASLMKGTIPVYFWRCDVFYTIPTWLSQHHGQNKMFDDTHPISI